MSDDASAPPATDKPKPTRHKPTAIELASVAAAIDPLLSKENPSRAVHLAAELIRAAQERIAIEQLFTAGSPHSPFNDEEEEETAEAACDRYAREFLFRNGVTVSEAFKKWGPASGYKTEGRFAAALRKADLSRETFGEGFSTVEMTSELAVKELPGWKKEREQKSNRESKERVSKKNFAKKHREFRGSKRERRSQKREPKAQKRESQL
jgi:hypothetical protein